MMLIGLDWVGEGEGRWRSGGTWHEKYVVEERSVVAATFGVLKGTANHTS